MFKKRTMLKRRWCEPLNPEAVLNPDPGSACVLLPCRSQAGNLAQLIAQIQKNADRVEKDVLRSEQLLAVVRTNRDNVLLISHMNKASAHLLSAPTRTMKMKRRSSPFSIKRSLKSNWEMPRSS